VPLASADKAVMTSIRSHRQLRDLRHQPTHQVREATGSANRQSHEVKRARLRVHAALAPASHPTDIRSGVGAGEQGGERAPAGSRAEGIHSTLTASQVAKGTTGRRTPRHSTARLASATSRCPVIGER